jgi:hypothetical protein
MSENEDTKELKGLIEIQENFTKITACEVVCVDSGAIFF